MERAEWLKRMRSMAEDLYDLLSPKYWVAYGLKVSETHHACIQKFLERVAPGGAVLSAGCGAGLYEGFLLDAGHPVVGIDQSEGMLRRAREHHPQARYQKMGMQEIDFLEAFAGVICIDALEHICPEDYPLILRKFQQALKPGGVLYFTVDHEPDVDLQVVYEQARAMGLPVVYGEVVDRVEASYARIKASGPQASDEGEDAAVYHFYPSLDQVRQWLDQAGLAIEDEAPGGGYYHFLAGEGERAA